MKLNIFEKLLLTFNVFFLVFQLMLMGSIPSFFNFSILNLFVPVVVLVNLLLFCYWVIKIKWPFLLFMGAFLMGYGEWNLLYQFPSNTFRTSSSSISVMSYNVRLFNKYNWIEGTDVSKEIAQMIQEKNPDIICFQETRCNKTFGETHIKISGYNSFFNESIDFDPDLIDDINCIV